MKLDPEPTDALADRILEAWRVPEGILGIPEAPQTGGIMPCAHACALPRVHADCLLEIHGLPPCVGNDHLMTLWRHINLLSLMKRRDNVILILGAIDMNLLGHVTQAANTGTIKQVPFQPVNATQLRIGSHRTSNFHLRVLDHQVIDKDLWYQNSMVPEW